MLQIAGYSHLLNNGNNGPCRASSPTDNLRSAWNESGCAEPGCGLVWYSNSTDLETAAFLDGGQALNHSADPKALDSNGQFSPAIIFDDAEKSWYLFYSATGKNGSAARRCVTEPTGCESSQMVASSASPHGPWRKLGAVVSENGLFAPFIVCKNEHSTTTGSGQT